MLRREDNELVTRVGPGTPMGALMREYWIPVLFSTELAEPDCAPLRVRLLGEDLIAFRDSDGQIGMVAQNCPHRGASLFFGRNEEAGLRCVYHGWKFNAEGACVDMPNEPPESNFKHRVRVTAYPCQERNGIVWTYMGPRQSPPPLPSFEWNMVPEGHSYVSKRVAENNWLQALEGGIDTSHANFLHKSLGAKGGSGFGGSAPRRASSGLEYMARDSHPRFECLPTEGGVLIGARREGDADNYYWRINPFLMPFYTMFPSTGVDPSASGHVWVPIDDEHTLVLHFTYHPTRPLGSDELEYMRSGRDGLDGFHPNANGFLPVTGRAFGSWYPNLNRDNLYGLDYEAQKTKLFCGIPAGWAQDSATQESMGAITDRTREHLGSSDVGIISARRFLINAAIAHRDQGAPAPGAMNPEAFALRPAAVLVSRRKSVWEVASTVTAVRPGTNFAVV
jgi:phthalate 4,5-dioxygenase